MNSQQHRLHTDGPPAAVSVDAGSVAAAIKGRGTALAMSGRFESVERHPVDDGWPAMEAEGAGAGRTRTLVQVENARTIITRNRSPDIAFNLSINPYRGCEHGCIYCYARPNHGYLGLSPGLDFETRLFAKVNAPVLFVAEIGQANYRCEPINIGSVTDPYQPIERQFGITRQLLEAALKHRQPVTLITKGSLVERDLDLLAELARLQLAMVVVTVTTLDAELARRLEPRASAPWRRLEIIRRLTAAGVPVSVSLGPVIPFINDHELESLLSASREAGARGAHYTLIRLPLEVAPLFEQWLQAHYPDRASRVMHRIQDMRSGRNYDSRYFSRMKGQGVLADLIGMRFDAAVRKLGLNQHLPQLRTDRFLKPGLPPPQLAGEAQQLTLI